MCEQCCYRPQFSILQSCCMSLFSLPAIPFTFRVIGVGFIMKSCRSFVMEADAPSLNMRGCESESKEFLHKSFLKCVDIVCMLQCPFDNHILLWYFCLLFRVFHLRCCLRSLFTPVLIHTSKRIQTIFIRRLLHARILFLGGLFLLGMLGMSCVQS